MTDAGHEQGERRIPYSFALLRVVPHPHTGACATIAVVLHAPVASYIGLRAITGHDALAQRAGDADVGLLARYLATYEAACASDLAAGPLALGSPSERFHWLTAPRSDVIQAGPVHEGICADPAAELDALFAAFVAA